MFSFRPSAFLLALMLLGAGCGPLPSQNEDLSKGGRAPKQTSEGKRLENSPAPVVPQSTESSLRPLSDDEIRKALQGGLYVIDVPEVEGVASGTVLAEFFEDGRYAMFSVFEIKADLGTKYALLGMGSYRLTQGKMRLNPSRAMSCPPTVLEPAAQWMEEGEPITVLRDGTLVSGDERVSKRKAPSLRSLEARAQLEPLLRCPNPDAAPVWPAGFTVEGAR